MAAGVPYVVVPDLGVPALPVVLYPSSLPPKKPACNDRRYRSSKKASMMMNASNVFCMKYITGETKLHIREDNVKLFPNKFAEHKI